MRVNIQYAVELDDIPGEVIKILREFDDRLTNLHPAQFRNIKVFIMEGSLPNALEEIDRLRLNLAAFDQRLEDAETLLRGYMAEITPRLVNKEKPDLTEEEEKQNVD